MEHPVNHLDNLTTNVHNKEVVYIGSLLNGWGHCITNNLARLWFLLDTVNKENYEQCLIGYSLFYDDTELSQSFVHLLNLLGVKEECLINIDVTTAFKKVYLPDECFVSGISRPERFYTNEYIKIINALIETCNVKKRNDLGDKIYFSREKLNDGRDCGESQISNEFKKKGFKIYYPELLTFEEQVEILQNCSVFATTEGSVAHNAVFLNRNADLVIIRKADYVNSFQTVINKAFEMNVILIDANKTSTLFSEDIISAGPFFLYVGKYLCRYLDIRYPGFPLSDYIRYLFPLVTHRFKIYVIKRCIKFFRAILGDEKYQIINNIRKHQ